jgi:Rhodopirellula transposase DDE domain
VQRWWERPAGLPIKADWLLVAADAGGPNGYRDRLWKTELARFAGETGLADCAKRVSELLALDSSARDESVNLSDSHPETHQHFSPAGASCCYSLLLDPDATMAIDLHKRLFLLVNGRGE